jgi:hypothetical protein
VAVSWRSCINAANLSKLSNIKSLQHNKYFYNRSRRHKLEKNDLVRTAKLSKENPDQVYFIDASIMYYFPNTNFISSDMGKFAAEDIIKNYKNKILISE